MEPSTCARLVASPEPSAATTMSTLIGVAFATAEAAEELAEPSVATTA
ncbi:hypothetical protein [Clavibacter michiganensis]|nr:hypothetical protein [Clavibacter michiganensis]